MPVTLISSFGTTLCSSRIKSNYLNRYIGPQDSVTMITAPLETILRIEQRHHITWRRLVPGFMDRGERVFVRRV